MLFTCPPDRSVTSRILRTAKQTPRLNGPRILMKRGLIFCDIEAGTTRKRYFSTAIFQSSALLAAIILPLYPGTADSSHLRTSYLVIRNIVQFRAYQDI
jgi:hypothetical protein